MTAAQLFDYDNDGLLDLFVIAAGRPLVFRNVGTGWQEQAAAVSAVQAGIPRNRLSRRSRPAISTWMAIPMS